MRRFMAGVYRHTHAVQSAVIHTYIHTYIHACINDKVCRRCVQVYTHPTECCYTYIHTYMRVLTRRFVAGVYRYTHTRQSAVDRSRVLPLQEVCQRHVWLTTLEQAHRHCVRGACGCSFGIRMYVFMLLLCANQIVDQHLITLFEVCLIYIYIYIYIYMLFTCIHAFIVYESDRRPTHNHSVRSMSQYTS